MKNLKFTLVVFFLWVATAHAQASNAPSRHFNVSLPPGTKQISENRFQSSRSYEDTKKDFNVRFKSTTIKKIGDEINLPHVRATLYKNTDKNAPFFGVNIYLNVQSGITEIFFLTEPNRENP